MTCEKKYWATLSANQIATSFDETHLVIAADSDSTGDLRSESQNADFRFKETAFSTEEAFHLSSTFARGRESFVTFREYKVGETTRSMLITTSWISSLKRVLLGTPLHAKAWNGS